MFLPGSSRLFLGGLSGSVEMVSYLTVGRMPDKIIRMAALFAEGWRHVVAQPLHDFADQWPVVRYFRLIE